ncbi:hypothetical protein EVAR_69442_1, partial [Eumeta japonica]
VQIRIQVEKNIRGGGGGTARAPAVEGDQSGQHYFSPLKEVHRMDSVPFLRRKSTKSEPRFRGLIGSQITAITVKATAGGGAANNYYCLGGCNGSVNERRYWMKRQYLMKLVTVTVIAEARAARGGRHLVCASHLPTIPKDGAPL